MKQQTQVGIIDLEFKHFLVRSLIRGYEGENTGHGVKSCGGLKPGQMIKKQRDSMNSCPESGEGLIEGHLGSVIGPVLFNIQGSNISFSTVKTEAFHCKPDFDCSELGQNQTNLPEISQPDYYKRAELYWKGNWIKCWGDECCKTGGGFTF